MYEIKFTMTGLDGEVRSWRWGPYDSWQEAYDTCEEALARYNRFEGMDHLPAAWVEKAKRAKLRVVGGVLQVSE